jgi:GDP-L-fucose synthase
MTYQISGERIWVAGHRGMVGSALVRRLQSENCEVLTVGRDFLDLTDASAVTRWVKANKPAIIVMAAAKVGGINANNSLPAEFLYQNLAIATSVTHAAHLADVDRMLFLGSSCIYPKTAPQPITEDTLLTGPLEPTNEWYAIAKIAGIKLSEAYRRQYGRDYISAMPTNLYGPGDNFDLQSSHVIPALIHKAHRSKMESAKSLTIWGSGTPKREFLYVDDCADACVTLLKLYSEDQHINIGSGVDRTILEAAQSVCATVGFDGDIICDSSMPDGTPRKLMSANKIRSLGWSPKFSFEQGLALTYRWFLEQIQKTV